MFDFLKKKKSVVFEVFDPDGDLVMSDGEPITKMAFNEVIKLDPDSYSPGKYECSCNGQIIWTRTVKEKVVKSEDVGDNEPDDPLSAVKDSVTRINQERETLTEFKSSLDAILGSGNIIDMSNAPENLKDGISKGMGAAVYSGLLKNDTEAVNRVFGLMDGATAALTGLGVYLSSESQKTGKSKLSNLVGDVANKAKPSTPKPEQKEPQEHSQPRKVSVVSTDTHKKTVEVGKPKIEKDEPLPEVEHDPVNDTATAWHEPVFDDDGDDYKHGTDE